MKLEEAIKTIVRILNKYDLSPEERLLVRQKLFPVPVRTMIEPFERYRELHERRSDPSLHRTFSDEDYRDIQTLWTLAWMDHDRRPRDLVRKGRAFTEEDKAALLRLEPAP